MLAKVCSAAVNDIDAYPVEVEVNAGFGDTLLIIVGLPDAAVVKGLRVIPIQNLREAVSFLESETKTSPVKVDIDRIFDQPSDDEMDFAKVKGQESVKRALEIAAAGGHNVLPDVHTLTKALLEWSGGGQDSSTHPAKLGRSCAPPATLHGFCKHESQPRRATSIGNRPFSLTPPVKSATPMLQRARHFFHWFPKNALSTEARATKAISNGTKPASRKPRLQPYLIRTMPQDLSHYLVSVTPGTTVQ